MKLLRESWTIGVLFGALLLASVDNQMLIPILPRLELEFDISMSHLGQLFSVYALTSCLFNLFLGPLTDRWKRIHFLRTSLGLFSILALCTYFSQGYGQLLLLRGMTGVVTGLISTCTSSLVGDFFPYHRRARVMGIVLSGYSVALILGVPIGTWIATRWHWRGVFFASSLLSSAVLVSLWGPLSNMISATSEKSKYYFTYTRYTRFLINNSQRSALLVSFAIAGGTMAILVYLSGYLSERFGLSPIQISWLFFAAGIAAAVSSLVSGWAADRWTKRRIFMFANLGFVLGVGCLIFVPWGNGLVVLFFIISLCVGFRQTALHTLQTQLIQIHERGSYIAFRNSFSQLGIGSIVFCAGQCYAYFGFAAVAALVALLAIVASVLFFINVQEPWERSNSIITP